MYTTFPKIEHQIQKASPHWFGLDRAGAFPFLAAYIRKIAPTGISLSHLIRITPTRASHPGANEQNMTWQRFLQVTIAKSGHPLHKKNFSHASAYFRVACGVTRVVLRSIFPFRKVCSPFYSICRVVSVATPAQNRREPPDACTYTDGHDNTNVIDKCNRTRVTFSPLYIVVLPQSTLNTAEVHLKMHSHRTGETLTLCVSQTAGCLNTLDHAPRFTSRCLDQDSPSPLRALLSLWLVQLDGYPSPNFYDASPKTISIRLV